MAELKEGIVVICDCGCKGATIILSCPEGGTATGFTLRGTRWETWKNATDRRNHELYPEPDKIWAMFVAAKLSGEIE